jgi:hypothetical protein
LGKDAQTPEVNPLRGPQIEEDLWIMSDTVARAMKKPTNGGHATKYTVTSLGVTVGGLFVLLTSVTTWIFMDLRGDYLKHKHHSDRMHQETLRALQMINAQSRQTCRVTVMLAQKQNVDTTAIDCTPPAMRMEEKEE